jgi:glycosyltransferase involved in cell wall biosynthesis
MRRAYEKGYKAVVRALGRPDLVHAQVLLYPVLIARWMKLVLGMPYVVTEHWSGYITGEYKRLGWFHKWISRVVVRGAKAVITPSARLGEAMMACGFRSRFHVVPNVVESVTTEVLPTRHDDRIRMMNLSDLWDDKKNVSGLIRATAEVASEDPRFELHIIGNGRDREMLTSLAQDLNVLDKHVFFHGELSNPDVYRFMKTIDFYITNSYVETFSISTVEAIASGKPVISTDCGGPSEYVTSEVGMLIPPGDHLALVNAMKRMASGFAKYDPRALMAYAQSRFSYDAVGRRLVEIYEASR